MTGPLTTTEPPPDGRRKSDAGAPRPHAPTEPVLVPVRLVGLPLEVAARSTEYHDGLVRELTLLALDDDQGRVLPAGLQALIQGLRGRLQGFTAGPSEEVARAVAAGATSVDVQLHVPSDVAGDMAALDQLLDQADRYCRDGEHLLTLAAPPEITAYRRWLLQQFTSQVRGAAPTPWQP